MKTNETLKAEVAVNNFVRELQDLGIENIVLGFTYPSGCDVRLATVGLGDFTTQLGVCERLRREILKTLTEKEQQE